MSLFLDPCTVYTEDFRYFPHDLKESAGPYLKNSPQCFIADGSGFIVTLSTTSNKLHVDEKYLSLENTVRNDNRKWKIST